VAVASRTEAGLGGDCGAKTKQQHMTRNNKKLRAVVLAALMVLWVFAGTVAFAGSAAAQTTVNTYNPDNPYQGQDVTVDDGNMVEGDE
jgi:surface glycoprotein (TIGR04207 family)